MGNFIKLFVILFLIPVLPVSAVDFSASSDGVDIIQFASVTTKPVAYKNGVASARIDSDTENIIQFASVTTKPVAYKNGVASARIDSDTENIIQFASVTTKPVFGGKDIQFSPEKESFWDRVKSLFGF